MAAIFAFWNLYDEFWVLQSWQGVLGAFGLWMLPVGLVTLMTLRSENPSKIRAGLTMTALIASLYVIYAINGSSQQRDSDGAEHMHIVLVPILLTIGVMLTTIVMGMLGIRDRRREPKRNA